MTHIARTIAALLCAFASIFVLDATARADDSDVYFAYRSFWPEHETMTRFASVGVKTFCIFPSNTSNSLGEPYSKYPAVWRYPKTYDWASLRAQFDDVLERIPDARFICMVDLNSPTWLARSLGMQVDGAFDSFIDLSSCLASARWKDATKEYLVDFLRETETRYGDKIVAYVLACGQTDEWMDYCGERTSRAKNDAWRKWRLEQGLEPTPWPQLDAFDGAAFENLVRNPKTEGVVLAAQRFEQELVADGILEFATLAKSKIASGKEIGVFFGYVLELTGWRAVGCGHLAYERVAASPAVDFFISPGTYSERPIGGGSGSMTPNETLLLAGKRRLHETDHRTTTYNCALNEFVGIAPIARWKSEDEDVAGLRRELCLALTDRASIWFFDMWGGSFASPRAIENVGTMKRVWDEYSERQGASAAEILLVVDPQSAARVNGRDERSPMIYHALRNRLNHVGAPFAACSFNDLASLDLSRVKLAVLPGSFFIDDARRAILRERLMRDDRLVLWLGPAGIDDGESLDVARVKETTGEEYGVDSTAPIERVGFFGEGDGRWRSALLSDYRQASAEKLRDFARRADVKIMLDDDSPVWATERLVAVHAARGGPKRIRLPRRGTRIVEVFSGTLVATDADEFVYDFSAPETALFDLDAEEK